MPAQARAFVFSDCYQRRLRPVLQPWPSLASAGPAADIGARVDRAVARQRRRRLRPSARRWPRPSSKRSNRGRPVFLSRRATASLGWAPTFSHLSALASTIAIDLGLGARVVGADDLDKTRHRAGTLCHTRRYDSWADVCCPCGVDEYEPFSVFLSCCHEARR